MNRQLYALACGLLSMLTYTACCRADTVTDWDTKATAAASAAALGEREVTIVDLAMYDAVNSIERRYQPYLEQLPTTEPTSADAAAASAAATALAELHPETAASFKAALAEYLAHLTAAPEALANGARLGDAVAHKILDARANDGATAVDSYRPKTKPGQYVPTAVMVCSTWSTMRPFALASPSQFRPGPPPSLKSREWATDYNEIKELGGKTSNKRSAQQTETARFWLMVGPQAYHPLARQRVLERHLSLIDSARFMALFSITLTDAYIAVFDAKYHYEFWRPITAIRNADLNNNPDTVRDATWQPLDNTPMHPEYPCAHCILSGAARVVLESLGQPMPELSLTSPTAPGVTHHWSNLDDFTTEVANARIWAGFHYRFSTRVGTALGRQVGQYVANKMMQPVAATAEAAAEPSPLPALKSVAVDVDITGLPASERAALVPLLRAARHIDSLYMRQVWPGTRALMRERQSAQTSASQAQLDALNFFKGPWGPTGTAFIGGVPSERPIGDFYPSDTTKHDIDIWLGTLSEPDRKRALNSFAAVERGQNGPFEVVSYARHYKDALTEAAGALREAATLTHEATLRNYLTLRAQALLDDDYYASDVAFVGLKGPIDVALGPYEVDDDAWFGAKTAYEASIALVNEPATQRVGRIATHLQELEDHLPLTPNLRGRKLGTAAPIVVLDVIYHGGMAGARGAAAGYGLPNDLRVLDAVGARTGTYSNILELRYDSTFRPIADAVLTDADRSTLRFEDIRDEVMFVRIFDSLGPQFVTGTKQPIAEALRESGAVAGQIRSMLLSLWGHSYLIEHGYLDRRETASLYSAFLIPALARARGGLASTPSQGSTYVLNHLLETGAISASVDGRFKINRAAADADIARAAMEFISLMAKGDATSVKSLLQRYVVVTPAIRDVLARLGPAPSLQRQVYRTADRLSPPAR